MEALGFHVMLLIQVNAEEESQTQLHSIDRGPGFTPELYGE
jgi:hypothetical protein